VAIGTVLTDIKSYTSTDTMTTAPAGSFGAKVVAYPTKLN